MQFLVAVSEVAEGLVQGPEKDSSPAGEARVHGFRALSSADKLDLILVEVGRKGGFPRELVPADRALVGQVPDAAFSIEQEIERRMD